MLEKTNAKRARRGSKTKVRVRVVEDGHARVQPDTLATEEPMEIRLISGGTRQTVAVTMRTPGADFELAAGFLYGEGIVSSPEDILKISYCVDTGLEAEQQYNILNVELREGRSYDPRLLERHFYTTSACGVCGKSSLEQLELRGCPVISPGPELAPAKIYALPEKLREAQGLFETPRAVCMRRRSSSKKASLWHSGRTWAPTTPPTSSSGGCSWR
jgi:FdhD protein